MCQAGEDRLPFLQGLSQLTARLPAKEAAAALRHLQDSAAPFKPVNTSSERLAHLSLPDSDANFGHLLLG